MQRRALPKLLIFLILPSLCVWLRHCVGRGADLLGRLSPTCLSLSPATWQVAKLAVVPAARTQQVLREAANKNEKAAQSHARQGVKSGPHLGDPKAPVIAEAVSLPFQLVAFRAANEDILVLDP